MLDEKLIKEIVKTYELPLKLEDKIVRIVANRMNQSSISGFDSAYRYIDDLIYKFKSYYNQRMLYLDSEIKQNSGNTFHDIIGFEDKELSSLFEYEDESLKVMRGKEIFGMLKNYLDKNQLRVLR